MGYLVAAPVPGHGEQELLALEREQPRRDRRPHSRRTGDVVEEGDLAEGFAPALVAAEEPVFEHLDLPRLDQEEAVPELALDDHLSAGAGPDRDEVVAEP